MVQADYTVFFKVIRFMPREKKEFPALAQVEGYWHALQNGIGVPLRADVDPRGLQPVLSHTFVLERVAPGVGRLRVAGQHLNGLMGMEVRGMPFTAMFVPEARPALSAAIDATCETPSLAYLTITAPGGIGRSALTGRMFMAPMKDRFGHITRILGALEVHGQSGRPPRRLGIGEVRHLPIEAVRRPQKEPAATATAPAPGFAEDQAVFQPAKPPAPGPSRPPHLRLVANNDSPEKS